MKKLFKLFLIPFLGITLCACNNTKLNNKTTNTTKETNKNAYITKEEALDAALTHAKLHKNDVSDIEIEIDKEYNRVIYEIQFDTGFKEYEYDIDATTKEIIFYEYD